MNDENKGLLSQITFNADECGDEMPVHIRGEAAESAEIESEQNQISDENKRLLSEITIKANEYGIADGLEKALHVCDEYIEGVRIETEPNYLMMAYAQIVLETANAIRMDIERELRIARAKAEIEENDHEEDL